MVKTKVVCAGSIIYFDSDAEADATSDNLVRQIDANNLAVEKCNELEMVK